MVIDSALYIYIVFKRWKIKLLNLNVSIKLDNNEKVVSLLKNIDSDIITLQEVTRAIGDNVSDRYNNSKLIKDQ